MMVMCGGDRRTFVGDGRRSVGVNVTEDGDGCRCHGKQLMVMALVVMKGQAIVRTFIAY